jgi:hypothetical protein
VRGSEERLRSASGGRCHVNPPKLQSFGW